LRPQRRGAARPRALRAGAELRRPLRRRRRTPRRAVITVTPPRYAPHVFPSSSPRLPRAADASPDASEIRAPEVVAMSVNLAVVPAVARGPPTRRPEVRILPSERGLAVLQITPGASSEAISVPVAVWAPPSWLTELDEGAELIALGTVRRRFFRAGASTASRVE